MDNNDKALKSKQTRIETSFTWNLLESPLNHSWNTFEIPQNFFEIKCQKTNHSWNILWKSRKLF